MKLLVAFPLRKKKESIPNKETEYRSEAMDRDKLPLGRELRGHLLFLLFATLIIHRHLGLR
jgi:hypothetical protein